MVMVQQSLPSGWHISSRPIRPIHLFIVIVMCCVAASNSLKSDISLVHEIALKRKFSVEFEVSDMAFFDVRIQIIVRYPLTRNY